MEKYRKLIDKLIEKNYSGIDIHMFLMCRCISSIPMFISSPMYPNFDRKIWEEINSSYIDDALVEIDFTRYK